MIMDPMLPLQPERIGAWVSEKSMCPASLQREPWASEQNLGRPLYKCECTASAAILMYPTAAKSRIRSGTHVAGTVHYALYHPYL